MKITRTVMHRVTFSGGVLAGLLGFLLERFLVELNWISAGFSTVIIGAAFVFGLAVSRQMLIDMFGEPIIDNPLTEEEFREAIRQKQALAEERNIAGMARIVAEYLGEAGSYTQNNLNCAAGSGRVVVRVPDGAQGWSTVFDGWRTLVRSGYKEEVILVPEESCVRVDTRLSATYDIPDRYDIKIYLPGGWEKELRRLFAIARERIYSAKLDAKKKARQRLQEKGAKFGI
jgi:hypothetical protein